MSTYVWISEQQLIDAHACSAGLEFFRGLIREQGRARKVRIQWSALAWCWLESGDRRWASWIYGNGIVPMPSFAKANLTGANLTGASLVGANLDGWERGADGYAKRAAS